MFRALIPLLGLSLLSACGFQPVYAERTADTHYRSDSRHALEGVKVLSVGGRNGQILQIALEDALYPGGSNAPTRYHLQVTPLVQEWPAVIETNQFVARTNMRLNVDAVLTDASTDTPIWKGRAVRQSSFNAGQADFATFVARDDALERGLQAVAQDLVMQIQAKLSEDNPSAKPISKAAAAKKTGDVPTMLLPVIPGDETAAPRY